MFFYVYYVDCVSNGQLLTVINHFDLVRGPPLNIIKFHYIMLVRFHNEVLPGSDNSLIIYAVSIHRPLKVNDYILFKHFILSKGKYCVCVSVIILCHHIIQLWTTHTRHRVSHENNIYSCRNTCGHIYGNNGDTASPKQWIWWPYSRYATCLSM